MSLTTCADCHRDISTLAVTCPHCGRPTAAAAAKAASPAAVAPPAEAASRASHALGTVIGCVFACFLLLTLLGGWLISSGIEAIQTQDDWDVVLGIPIHSKGTDAVVSGWVKCAVGGVMLLPCLLLVVWLIQWLCGLKPSARAAPRNQWE